MEVERLVENRVVGIALKSRIVTLGLGLVPILLNQLLLIFLYLQVIKMVEKK